MKGAEFIQQVLREEPFSKMHPQVAAFFKDYLAHEKVLRFDGKYVLSTHFPPYPSAAFDNMAAQFNALGEVEGRRLFSVTLAVTNRCSYNCWHCYNAGRSQQNVPLAVLQGVIRELQRLGVVHVTLTGGEPLLRLDLEEIAGTFDDSTYLTLNTTGSGLTPERAHALKEKGLFALGVSLDSADPEEHDRMRGNPEAFQTAVRALEMAAEAGLYPYIIAVCTHNLLQADRFEAFMEFAAEAGALEVHLLEPCATGKLAGNADVLLGTPERLQILAYQKEFARREDAPNLSSFLYVESPTAFGCGAGLTHMYIDGSGEVCPCNLTPMSFGNVTQEPLTRILERMGRHFRAPRPDCIGHIVNKHIASENLPLAPEASAAICEKHLPKRHALPRFFQVRNEAQGDVGPCEIKAAYNRIHGDYDSFWLSEAGKPIEDLINRLPLNSYARVFEAGCGTGYATLQLASRICVAGTVLGADLSEGMIAEARRRLRAAKIRNVRFMAGDALELLEDVGVQDLVFSSWVLGYIPLAPFFAKASRALAPEGHLAFVVHKQNSPRETLDIFEEIVAEDPSVLEKRVAFDFPRDMDHVRGELLSKGLEAEQLWEGQVTFRYTSPGQVLEHLLKSGAGTAFHDAIDPTRREVLEQRFLDTLAARRGGDSHYDVVHDYISCIAKKQDKAFGVSIRELEEE